ncbi:MAG: hypothetical protein HYX29_07245 [Solirubrobacterales bacterium]|nr:hypothetical protein [Solirubrobacterales bacterium]
MSQEKKRWSKVTLPAGTADPIEVYVNSITQRPDEDYEREGDSLYFFRPIRNEEKLGFFRWLILFIGIAGSYKQNDSVDVGSPSGHFVNLPIIQIEVPTDEERGMLIGSYSPGG